VKLRVASSSSIVAVTTPTRRPDRVSYPVTGLLALASSAT
jgi:hypothetical protein